MAIQQKLKKQILEDGKITDVEAQQLLDAAKGKGGLDARDREDLRAFFLKHEAALEPRARTLVDEALGIAARRLREKIVQDRRVTEEEAQFLVDEARRNGITEAERAEIQKLLTDYSGQLDPAAKKVLEEALGIGIEPVTRHKAVRDDKELAPVKDSLKLVDANKGQAVLQEIAVGGAKVNAAFKNDIAPKLKAFISGGKSSLKASEAMSLAQGLSGGNFKEGSDEPFLAGDRLQMTVHYQDGSKAETSGIVVSAGTSPLVLFVNKAGYLQMVRHDAKSKEQLTIREISAGRSKD